MFQPYKKPNTYLYSAWLPAVLLTLCIVSAVVMAAWGAYLLWSSLQAKKFFSFKQIHVVMDAQHLTGPSITRVVKAHLQGNFFSMNVPQLRQALLVEPWVADVAFRRIWPDVLEVDVVEQKPVAQWGNARLLNARGELFSPPLKTFPQHLPVLQGPLHTEQQVLAYYDQFQALLSKVGLQIVGLSLDPSRSVWLVLDDGLSVKLGQHNIQERLKKFISLYPSVIKNSEVKALTVDLRYPSGVAIEWQNSAGLKR